MPLEGANVLYILWSHEMEVVGRHFVYNGGEESPVERYWLLEGNRGSSN